jgi:hypothetical protein
MGVFVTSGVAIATGSKAHRCRSKAGPILRTNPGFLGGALSLRKAGSPFLPDALGFCLQKSGSDLNSK